MVKLIQENNFEKSRKGIKKAEQKKEKIIFMNDDDELNRKILEKQNIDLLVLKQSKRKDFQKQRNSGLNQILAKIAKKKNTDIGIYLDEIIESDKKNKIKILARIRQNIKICSKYKIKLKFVSEKYKKDIYDLKSLGLILGMPTWMTKEINFFNLK